MKTAVALFVVAALALVTTACFGNETNGVTSASPAPSATWRHKRNRVLVKLGSPRHSANDVIANPGTDIQVEGKFTYTKVSKDLQDESVTLSLLTGGKQVTIGSAITDSDGRARFTVPAAKLPASGAVRYRVSVDVDRTSTEGVIWLLAKGARVALYDIDGTLTIADSELIKATLFDSAIEARKGAQATVAFRKNAGLQPIYLTGRPYLYNQMTRAWLQKHHFPPGPLITADYVSEAMPTDSSVGEFKRKKLTELVNDRQLSFVAAYGNADTDVCAFPRAGIAPAATFIIGSKMTRCHGFDKHNAIDSFQTHNEALLKSPAHK